MKLLKIFIVEDDPMYAKILNFHLSKNPDYEIENFASGKECIKNLYKDPAIITLDYTLPDMSGMEVLKKIRKHNSDISVIIISGQENVSTAVNLLKEGAYDYLVKDNETRDRIWNSIKNIRENLELKNEISVLREEIEKKYEFNKILIGNSPSLFHVFSLMEKAIKSNITVSITGETGTGKELVAKAIHYNSQWKRKPFVVVNVSAVPKDLIESEMFGHEKGAFTGAISKRIGKFEEAHKGTLFLDEIGEMDLAMQSKLLRVLQEKEFTRVGGNGNVKVDLRVIVATHRNLLDDVKSGKFREDLYYRLLGLPIELPPLRDRGNDILILAKYFIDEFCKENKMPKVNISSSTQDKLMRYPFPGNVRELKAVMELSAVMTNSSTIDPDDVNFYSTSSMTDLLLQECSLQEYTRKIIKSYLNKYNNDMVVSTLVCLLHVKSFQ